MRKDRLNRIHAAAITLLLVALTASAQVTGPARTVRNGTSNPATCSTTTGNVFFRTDTGNLQVCTAANTWTVIGGGAGTGTVTNTGTLTANLLIKGNGGVDVTVSGVTDDGTTVSTAELVSLGGGTNSSGISTTARITTLGDWAASGGSTRLTIDDSTGYSTFTGGVVAATLGAATSQQHTVQSVASSVFALYSNKLSVFAATTSSEFMGVISNETGSGLVMGNNTPTIITPSFTTGFTIAGAATSRKIIVGNGTNFVASTETYAVPGTSGNVLTSDGTNWTSAAPAGGGITVGTTTITGGTDTKSLYNNAGVVGERTVTGTGNDVLATSPTFTTSLLTGSTTFAVFNVTPTTINAFGGATTVNIGAASATWNIGSNSTINGGTSANDDLTIQGTSSATRATSYVNLQPNGGWVGVGTASPLGLFHIKGTGGDIRLYAEGPDNQQTDFNIGATTGADRIIIGALLAGGSGYALIRSGATSSPVAIQYTGGNVGIGTIAPSAILHIISTTEQERIGYDTSNYYKTTVGSTGGVTFDAVGSGSAFTFSDGVTLATAKALSIASGTNQRAGNATLVGGTVTVTNATVTANTVVLLTRKTSGGTIGTAITYSVSASTSFTIQSDNILDTSTFSYVLVEVP